MRAGVDAAPRYEPADESYRTLWERESSEGHKQAGTRGAGGLRTTSTSRALLFMASIALAFNTVRYQSLDSLPMHYHH